MRPRRARWTAGVAAILAVVAAGGLRGEDQSPEDVLKSHGLKRVGTTYVLGSAEADVQKKVNELRLLSRQLNLAVQQQEALEQGSQDREAMIQEMLQQQIVLNDQITALDQEINSGNYFGAARNQLITQRNQIVTASNGLIARIKLLQSQGSDSKVRQQFQGEVSRRREAYTQVVLDLRKLVDTATRAYAELASNGAVVKALEAIGRTSPAQPKLGPSRAFQDNLRLLERVEKTVITDSVELRRTGGGVYEVDVTFNGKVTRPMIFDTGAGITLIPAKLAAEIGLEPSPSDPEVHCTTADGGVVIARQKTIPTMRVGRFIVNNVVCAVLPADKRNAEPLLGQSFHRHFTYKMSPGSGRLVISTVETLEPPQTRTGGRSAKTAAKAKRATRSKAAAGKAKAAGGPDGE
ncbi:MAG TPA: aspartyl protease family protein [Isosphaeraceae bacterium]|nr:aspartyl protease family protein [Isosphaeraceae bacterium]